MTTLAHPKMSVMLAPAGFGDRSTYINHGTHQKQSCGVSKKGVQSISRTPDIFVFI